MKLPPIGGHHDLAAAEREHRDANPRIVVVGEIDDFVENSLVSFRCADDIRLGGS